MVNKTGPVPAYAAKGPFFISISGCIFPLLLHKGIGKYVDSLYGKGIKGVGFFYIFIA